jgi:hypothetical protein
MILRSPAENKNAGISFHMVLSSTRHSRARGNPGLLRRISLDTYFRGYDGTQAGLSLSPQAGNFKGGTKNAKFTIKEIRTRRVRSPEFSRKVSFVVGKGFF